MPLRLRLAVLFALAAATVLGVVGAAFVLQLRISVEAALDPGLRTRVRAVADGLQSPEGFRPGSADDLVVVRAADGTLVAASQDAELPRLDQAQLRAARQGEVSFTSMVGGDRTRLLATTVSVAGSPLLVVVGSGTDVADAAVDRVRSALLLGGPPGVLLVGAGAWLLGGAALRPVERLRREAASIGDRDTDRRLPVPRTQDEIAALAETFNGLLGRLQDALRRERALVADTGHELRTPLAILRAELELATRPGRNPESLRHAVREAGAETDRLIRLTEDLLLLARADSGQPLVAPSVVRVEEILTAAARGAGHRASERATVIEVRCPAGLTVRADPDRLRQVLDNLLDNALRHGPDGGVVGVHATETTQGSVRVEVLDRGPGFPPEFLPHAFERFQRAEAGRGRDTGGTGLGLAIVRAVAEAHGGLATARNRPDGGAAVVLELPHTGPATTP